MYNVSTNEWHFIGSLNTWRVYGSMVCLSGTCYVLGGTKNNRDRLLSVECYDSTEDKWIEKISIPVERYSTENKDTFTGCVMKLSKGVLAKSDSIKEKPIGSLFGEPGTTSSRYGALKNFTLAPATGFNFATPLGLSAPTDTSAFNFGSIQSNQPAAAPVPVFELSGDDD